MARRIKSGPDAGAIGYRCAGCIEAAERDGRATASHFFRALQIFPTMAKFHLQ